MGLAGVERAFYKNAARKRQVKYSPVTQRATSSEHVVDKLVLQTPTATSRCFAYKSPVWVHLLKQDVDVQQVDVQQVEDRTNLCLGLVQAPQNTAQLIDGFTMAAASESMDSEGDRLDGLKRRVNRSGYRRL